MNQNQAPPEARHLLSTKLVPPQGRQQGGQQSLISRPRLLSRLDAGLDKKVTLISAPAGFGKTTLAGEWIATRRAENTLPPLAWVALDDGDNDPVRFWRYVLTACQALDGDGDQNSLGQTPLALLNNSPQPPFEALLTMLINDLTGLPGPLVLALEDFHVINTRKIHETLSFLIENAPAHLHLILVTRSDPPLPLARLRAYNALNELRAGDLRFTEEEAHRFLTLAVPVPLSEITTRQLAQRTEGWAVGLRLVSLAVQRMAGQQEIEQYLAGFSGSHRPILDYLLGDVFAAQSPAVQEFLLQTCFLDRFSAPLCDAVTDRDDSALLLEQMERGNLFIVPLQQADHWYRYHALFAEAMQHHAERQLGREQLRELAQKAAGWYQDNGMLAEATEAALFARDFAHAASLVERIIAPRLVQNEFHTLRRWMEQLPQDVLQAFPTICMTFATAILFTSPRHLPETKQRLQFPLQIAEAHRRQQQDDHGLGEVYAFRSLVDWLQGDFKESFANAYESLDLLPDDDRQWRGISLIMLAVEDLFNGDVRRARKTAEEALARCEAAQNIYGTLDSLLLLGEICYREAELQQARQIFTDVLSRTENAPMNRDQAAIRAARARMGLGLLHLEWNELEEAHEDVAEAVAGSERFAEEYVLTDAPLVLAHVLFARGEIEKAQEQVDLLLTQPGRRTLFRFPGPYRVRLALAAGDLATAQRWAHQIGFSDDDNNDSWPLQRRQESLVSARLQISQDQAADALPALEQWLHEARDRAHTRSEIELSVVLAQAYGDAGRIEEAHEMLIQALERGQAANHRRIFLDEGKRLGMLLQDTIPQIEGKSLAAYARALFYTLSQEQSRLASEKETPDASAEWLVEPLTDQELRVLRLLAACLSNPQIGEELVISVNTVKTHVKNIYGKLNVSSREEASEAARQLDLL